jgi:hypothetical protein
MKKLIKIIGGRIAVAAAFVLSASTAPAQDFPNLLVNGGFEYAGGFTADPITLASGGINGGWALFGATAQSDMFYSADYPQSGCYALLEQNVPGNNWNPVGAYQIVSSYITPGWSYTFSIYLLTDTGTSWGPNPVDLQLSFLDANLTDLGGTGGWNTAPGFNSWSLGSVSALAPVGAQYAVVYAMFMDDGQTTTENVYFDNASLIGPMDIPPGPEPSTLALVGMGLVVSSCFIRKRKS